MKQHAIASSYNAWNAEGPQIVDSERIGRGRRPLMKAEEPSLQVVKTCSWPQLPATCTSVKMDFLPPLVKANQVEQVASIRTPETVYYRNHGRSAGAERFFPYTVGRKIGFDRRKDESQSEFSAPGPSPTLFINRRFGPKIINPVYKPLFINRFINTTNKQYPRTPLGHSSTMLGLWALRSMLEFRPEMHCYLVRAVGGNENFSNRQEESESKIWLHNHLLDSRTLDGTEAVNFHQNSLLLLNLGPLAASLHLDFASLIAGRKSTMQARYAKVFIAQPNVSWSDVVIAVSATWVGEGNSDTTPSNTSLDRRDEQNSDLT
ncbi:hypothetical protein DFH06DRAFT_1128703 [Mycena polygramma]|nr:hypothetical protein DFH06DRAFT_1128703 [Mycena polygramma]